VKFIISQDIVVTRSGFAVKYNDYIVVNLILNSMLKILKKSVNICLRYGQKYRGPLFDSQRTVGSMAKRSTNCRLHVRTRLRTCFNVADE
jgi:hypothetical protein